MIAEPRIAGGPLTFLNKRVRLLAETFLTMFRSRRGKLTLVLTATLLAGTAGMTFERYLAETEPVPEAGGVYVEGVTGNRNQFMDIASRLTQAGLVSLTANRQVIPILAEAWALSEDGETYTFILREGVSSEEVARIAKEQELFKTVSIETPDPRTVVFRLKQPFGPFLSFLSLPLFTPGPYVLDSELENELTFTANPSFPVGKPFLEHITVRMYADNRALKQAAARGEISGAVTEESIARWQRFTTPLPRTIQAIVNIEKVVLNDHAVRKILFAGESLPEAPTVRIVTTPQLKMYAEDLRTRWETQNVSATIELIEDATIRQSVIPKREYDVLVYGVDSGTEPDPYRFWHSSQATETGLNLAQLKDEELDGLLEEARKIVSDEKRFPKYQEIEQKITELAVRLILEQVSVTYQMSPLLKGVEQPFMINPASRYNFSWKWYTNERRVPRKTEDGGQKTE